jgi:prepilin-type N-terminal cleavage/methylation domain-containing protein
MKSSKAFTLVELLIVIVVIAILAAISVVAYNGIQERARGAAVSSALSQAAKKIALWQVDNPGISPASLSDVGIVNTDTVTYQYSQTNNNQDYCITATTGNTSYYLNSTTQTSPAKGGCAGHGVGGQQAITNLVVNPSFEGGINGYTTSQSYAVDTSWKSSGTSSLRITPNTSSTDSFASIGGDVGGFRAGLQPGKTYTVSAKIRLSAALTGSVGGRSRQVIAWYTSASGVHTATTGTQVPNSAGEARSTVTFSIPSDAIGAWIRLYHGGASGSGSVWFDDVMITEGSTSYNYNDPITNNSWVWNGTPNNSTSTGPAQ